jgi:23S rRNA U2552 (ribose-2'-O)-methylase RlmE/FtsJ
MSDLTAQLRTKAGRLRGSRGQRGWLRLPEGRPVDRGVKPPPYLPIYERLFVDLRKRAFALLELGVWGGHSLEMWRDAFENATVVGLDLNPPDADLGERVHMVRGDQSDATLLRSVREKYAPHGFEVIIDDASHLGVSTARSLQALYAEHLRPGGLYCIEDWGTGYLTEWPDGGRMWSRLEVAALDTATSQSKAEEALHMPSHDLGTVGLVKRLIDHTAVGSVRYGQSDSVVDALEIETMMVWDGIVVLRKPDANRSS